MADITYYKTEMEGATMERAKAVGMDYDGVLKVCGVNSSVCDSAKKLYKVHCKLKDYEQIRLRWHKHRPDWCPFVTGAEREETMNEDR